MKILSLEKYFYNFINNFDGKFQVSEYNGFHAECGFKAILKINFIPRTTETHFNFKSATGYIISNKLIVQGYLNDMFEMLNLIF